MGTAVCSPDPATLVGLTEASFDLSCSATGTATIADTSNVTSLAERRITALVASGFALVNGSVKTQLGTPAVDAGSVRVPVTATASQVQKITTDQLRKNIVGKSVSEARAYLQTFGNVSISMSPSWADKMPSLDFRIDVKLVVPKVTATPSPSTASLPPPGPTATPTPRHTPTIRPTGPPSESASPSGSVPPDYRRRRRRRSRLRRQIRLHRLRRRPRLRHRPRPRRHRPPPPVRRPLDGFSRQRGIRRKRFARRSGRGARSTRSIPRHRPRRQANRDRRGGSADRVR